MKIFDVAANREADRVTVERQGITYYELMERAGTEVFQWLKRNFPDKETLFHVICGQGNNGGDGLVVARLLYESKYRVVLDILEDAGKPTPDFTANLKRINKDGIKYNNKEIYQYTDGKLVVIDAIFGIGLSREPEGSVKEMIEKINHSNAYVVSIDVPSGVFMDRKTNFAVHSDVVLTFQQPKLSFYLSDNYQYLKKVEILDIGLDRDFINTVETNYYLTDSFEAHKRYIPIDSFTHKGKQGHALIIGGSYGKIGAVCLAAKSALKSGCGLITAYLPKCGYVVIQTAFPEAMAITDGDEHITHINFDFEPKAIGIGPGMGQHPETQKAFHDFLIRYKHPLVIDADGLNILSYNKEWVELLPENTILTPHPKELERLMGTWNDGFDKIEKMKAFCKKYHVILVAKDARTMVVYCNEVHINASGNAALATGGSGDTLTGIITGLLAQGYTAADAAVFGVYLHGLTADIALPQTGMQAFTASMIPDYIGKAYHEIESNHP